MQKIYSIFSCIHIRAYNIEKKQKITSIIYSLKIEKIFCFFSILIYANKSFFAAKKKLKYFFA